MEEVVEVWINFFGSPTIGRARYEGITIRETNKTGRLV